jgi:two-component system chemotaxis sensor kinase CheA
MRKGRNEDWRSYTQGKGLTLMNQLLQNGRQMSLILTLRNRLAFATLLLVSAFIFSAWMNITLAQAQDSLGEQKVELHDEVNSLQLGMVNQETSLRGYVLTNDPAFLVPFHNYRLVYLAALQQLQARLSSGDFAASAESAIIAVQSRATDWYAQFALVQLQNMQSSKFSTARSVATLDIGKAFFDLFRTTILPLQLLINENIANLQMRLTRTVWSAVIFSTLIALAAIIMISRAFVTYATILRQQLDVLVLASTRLERGELTVRTTEFTSQELHLLGQNFNSMANALEQQHRSLEQRDVMESVLRINTTLAGSLDLQTCIEDFLGTILKVLDLHLGALYLYNPEQKRLILFTSLGADREQLATTFEPGEGVIGRVALSREPFSLNQSTCEEVPGTVIKLMRGSVTPLSSYYLPLFRGNELVGVLGVGSADTMGEKAHNILNIVVSNLSAMISNARAYQHIQAQADEQERLNTELRQQRDELRVLNLALEEANKARSEFLSTMSHELRTPLASIIGFSQMLLDDTDIASLNQKQQNSLERILNNGQHLLGLINDVLDLTKIEAHRMVVNYSQVDIKELLTSVVEETQSIAMTQHIVLGVEVQEGIDFIESNALKLRQILLNLVSNALKFTEQGEVTVVATRVICPEHESDQIAITVKDSGIGIPVEIQARIFEAFYQADGSYTRKSGGTGLGLAIVSKLTALLGGTITVKSAPGQGSTFTVLLPFKGVPHSLEQVLPHLYAEQSQKAPVIFSSAAELSPEIREALFAVSTAADGQNRLVLAVDDSPDGLLLIKAALQDTSYTVVAVQDPLQAIELVKELRPCAITLDVMMPNLNGWQLLNQLKASPATASIPVVMITVLSEPTTGSVLGADAYLIKPFKTEVLHSTLQDLTASQKNPFQESQSETQPV